MNHPAEALFESVHGGMLSFTKALASQLRALLGPEKLLAQQHKELEAIIRGEFGALIWYILGRFDNVGCSLPPGVLGFDIIARLCAERESALFTPVQKADIREAEQDYADMWLEYLSQMNEEESRKG